jgi:hypothetical protein
VTLDDAEAQVFAQKRRWYHAHCIALFSALASFVVGYWITPVLILVGPCLVLAGIAAIRGERSLLRFHKYDDHIAIDSEAGVDGVAVDSYQHFWLVVMILIGVVATFGFALHVFELI